MPAKKPALPKRRAGPELEFLGRVAASDQRPAASRHPDQPPIDLENPLAPLPGETPKAIEALRIYAELGPGRSIDAVRKSNGFKTARHLENWSSRFRWRERIAAWVAKQRGKLDDAVAELRQSAFAETYEAYKRVENAAWEEFERSKLPTERKREAAASDEADGAPGTAKGKAKRRVNKVERLTETNLADPRYLNIVMSARGDIRKLLGLDAPTRVQAEVDATVTAPNSLAAALAMAMGREKGEEGTKET